MVRRLEEHLLAFDDFPRVTTDDSGIYRVELVDGKELFLQLSDDAVTYETLLAIVADRLRFFQGLKRIPGPRSKGTACALTHIEEAIMWLQRDIVMGPGR